MNGGLIYAVLGAVGFSFKAILIKLAYRYGVDAETLLALRMGYALPFFLAMGWFVERRAAAPLAGRDWLLLLGLGYLGYYLASYLDFLGLRYISAALERLTLFLNPSIVVILSALFLGKPLTFPTLAALALSYVGLGLVVVQDFGAAPEGGQILLGCGLVMASALSYALYLMGNGEVVGRLGAARVTAWASSAACVLSLGQFALLRPVSALAQPWQVHALAGAMALVSTVLPIWLMSEAMRRLGAGPVAIIGTLGPVITLVLGWTVLGEAFGWAQLVGAGLVLTGVLASRRKAAPAGALKPAAAAN